MATSDLLPSLRRGMRIIAGNWQACKIIYFLFSRRRPCSEKIQIVRAEVCPTFTFWSFLCYRNKSWHRRQRPDLRPPTNAAVVMGSRNVIGCGWWTAAKHRNRHGLAGRFVGMSKRSISGTPTATPRFVTLRKGVRDDCLPSKRSGTAE